MEAVSTRLRLRISPGASRPGVVGRHGAAWKIRVAAPPEDGRANDAVTTLLASVLGVPRDAVVLRSGRGSRDKTVELQGLDLPEAERRLATAAERQTR
ncbi:MAG TPA: DUF167 domain-containing protein [Gaiellaceae bacterium]